MGDTISRQLQLLQLVPRLPQRITVRELIARLPQNDKRVALRTVQRDLDQLSHKFPLTCDLEGRTQYWYWTKGAQQLAIPHMSASMAATLQLARDYLKPVLPASVLSELDPLFNHASEVLDGTPLKSWTHKVRILDRGPMLIPPKVSPAVRDSVYQALLEVRQIQIAYKARGKDGHKDYTVNPLGLVVKGGVFYLVVTFDGYTDIRQLALHRMNRAELLAVSAQVPKRFSLKAYIEDEAGFSYPLSPEKIELELRFEPDAAFHLTELKLAPDQQVQTDGDGCLRVTATVADTEELRWWLRGYGEAVEVLEPGVLRAEFGARA